MFKRDWTTSWILKNHSTLDNEHSWKDPWIQLKNQHTYSFDNHNQIIEGLISYMNVVDDR